jgi:DNA-binding response OmpR family regulator
MPEPRTVLVLEDEALIALDLEATLEDAGWSVIGPVGTLSRARDLVARSRPDIACLELNLGGETSHDLARDLLAQEVPVVFISGRDARALPEDLRAVPMLGKPVDPALLLRTLADKVG